jgi:hypothetical protein
MGEEAEDVAGVRVTHLDELDRIGVAGVTWRPLRPLLEVTAFGVNAYTADAAGDHLIEEHDETGAGSGKHEELYVVLTGRATFWLNGQERDAPAGTFLFVHDPTVRRSAMSAAPGTTVLVVGGRTGAALPVSPWEYYFAAAPAREAGDPARAAEIVAEGLREHPDHPRVHYELACHLAMAGDREGAFRHIEKAIVDPRVREWVIEDPDFDSIRDDPRFPNGGSGPG